jgi:hypothetical protein
MLLKPAATNHETNAFFIMLSSPWRSDVYQATLEGHANHVCAGGIVGFAEVPS